MIPIMRPVPFDPSDPQSGGERRVDDMQELDWGHEVLLTSTRSALEHPMLAAEEGEVLTVVATMLRHGLVMMLPTYLPNRRAYSNDRISARIETGEIVDWGPIKPRGMSNWLWVKCCRDALAQGWLERTSVAVLSLPGAIHLLNLYGVSDLGMRALSVQAPSYEAMRERAKARTASWARMLGQVLSLAGAFDEGELNLPSLSLAVPGGDGALEQIEQLRIMIEEMRDALQGHADNLDAFLTLIEPVVPNVPGISPNASSRRTLP